MQAILTLFFCLTFSYLLSRLFKKIGLPNILGPLFIGFILGIPLISKYLFDVQSLQSLEYLAELGLIFLLFFTGLKINVRQFVKFKPKVINIGLMAAIIPFIFGLLFGLINNLGWITSIIIGSCLSVSAEAVSMIVLKDLNLLNSRTGELIIEASVIDDIFEIIIIATIGVIVNTLRESGTVYMGIGRILLDIVIFATLIYIVKVLFIPLTWKLLDSKPNKSELFTASFIIVLFMAAASNYLELGSVIGALLAGIIIKQTLIKENKESEEREVADIIETVTFGFLEPLFFIWIGLNANLGLLVINPWLAVILTVLALLGKLIGSIIGAWMSKENMHTALLVGWGLNARGAVELIAAEIGRKYGLISDEIYAAIVFMAFFTTIISPIVFKNLVKYFHFGPGQKQINP